MTVKIPVAAGAPKRSWITKSLAAPPISNDSALMVTQDNGTFGFAATEYGNYHDNPDHPEDLDHVQLSRAVAFFFNSSMSSFSPDYSVRRSRGGRNVLFGGASRVACADEAK